MTTVKIKTIYDFLSLFVLGGIFYIIITLDVVAMFGIGIISFIQTILKKVTTGIQPQSIFKRPDDAKDCGLFNTNGSVGHKSGFPSGHMCFMSMVMIYLFLKTNKRTFENFLWYHILIVFVAIGRYGKRCHNLLQILMGYIVGVAVAMGCFYIQTIPTFKPIRRVNHYASSFLKYSI